MNRAVTRPQAMNAPMFGITMPARNAPNFWTWALSPVPYTAGVYAVAMMSSKTFSQVNGGCGASLCGEPCCAVLFGWLRTLVRARIRCGVKAVFVVVLGTARGFVLFSVPFIALFWFRFVSDLFLCVGSGSVFRLSP